MAVEPIKEELLEGLTIQAKGILEELCSKLGILVGRKVEFGECEYLYGDFATYFKQNKKKYILTDMAWDDHKGAVFFLAGYDFAIACSSFLMGSPEKMVADKMESGDLGDDLFEVYQEVSNQICGIFNQIVSDLVDANAHFTLKNTVQLPANGSKNKNYINEEWPHLYVKVPMQVEGTPDSTLILCVTTNFAPDLFETDLGGAAAFSDNPEEAGDGQGGEEDGSLGSMDLDKIRVEKIMSRNYPTIDMSHSIGDAYEIMEEKRVEALPVTDKGKVVRMVTKNNIEIIRSVFFDAPGQEERIARLMCIPLAEVNKDQILVSAKAEDNMKEVVANFLRHKIDYIPILDENKELVGLITARTVLEMVSDG